MSTTRAARSIDAAALDIDSTPSLEKEDSHTLLPKTKLFAVSPLLCASGTCNMVLLIFVIILVGVAWTVPNVPALDGSRSACSDHGIMFADAGGVCACFDCWSGRICSERQPDSSTSCIVSANSGTPYMYESYWVEHPRAAITIAASYHIGYGDTVPRLEAAIRSMHKLVGNAVVDSSKHIVIGIGSTELINAAMYALSDNIDPVRPRSPAMVWSQSPFYSGYTKPAGFFRSQSFQWAWDVDPNASSSVAPSSSADQTVIELVTSPNNPDGHIRTPQVSGRFSRVVMDHAYLWPHFVAVSSPIDYRDDRLLALFTLSKGAQPFMGVMLLAQLSGHASTRIGWAIASSAAVAERVRRFVSMVSLGIPRENQLRAVSVINHIVEHDGEIFRFARRLMLSRWARLEALFERHSSRMKGARPLYLLEPREAGARDTFSGEDRYRPSPAYAWIERTDGGNASAAMEQVGIEGRSGDQFGASISFIRLELLMREQTFDILLNKLAMLLD